MNKKEIFSILIVDDGSQDFLTLENLLEDPYLNIVKATSGQQALDLLARLPEVDPADLHALGDALAGTDPQPLAAFLDTVNGWLAQRLDGGRGDLARLNRLAEASEHINAAARDAETYNLERKPLVFNVFGLLAEATRG